VLSVAVAYWLNIGHRLFPRDATEDLPSRRTRFLFPPDATSSRLCYSGISLGWSGFRVAVALSVQHFATLPQPILPESLSAGRFVDTAGHPLTQPATRIHARAARGAEQSRKPLFGEPGGLRYPRAELSKAKTVR
jgi:hypothetical protein